MYRTGGEGFRNTDDERLDSSSTVQSGYNMLIFSTSIISFK